VQKKYEIFKGYLTQIFFHFFGSKKLTKKLFIKIQKIVKFIVWFRNGSFRFGVTNVDPASFRDIELPKLYFLFIFYLILIKILKKFKFYSKKFSGLPVPI